MHDYCLHCNLRVCNGKELLGVALAFPARDSPEIGHHFYVISQASQATTWQAAAERK